MSRKIYGQTRTIPFRRKREGKTNYRKRLALLKSGKHRLVIRRLLGTIVCQLVDYHPDGDKVLFAVSSRDLRKLGWKGHAANTPSAYLTGLLLGKKAVAGGIKSAILDIGLHNSMKGSRIYAALKGVLDAGLNVPSSEDSLPSDERVSGKHIEDYAKKLKGSPAYEKQFSLYIKAGLKPEELSSSFEDVKKKIISM